MLKRNARYLDMTGKIINVFHFLKKFRYLDKTRTTIMLFIVKKKCPLFRHNSNNNLLLKINVHYLIYVFHC